MKGSEAYLTWKKGALNYSHRVFLYKRFTAEAKKHVICALLRHHTTQSPVSHSCDVWQVTCGVMCDVWRGSDSPHTRHVLRHVQGRVGGPVAVHISRHKDSDGWPVATVASSSSLTVLIAQCWQCLALWLRSDAAQTTGDRYFEKYKSL